MERQHSLTSACTLHHAAEWGCWMWGLIDDIAPRVERLGYLGPFVQTCGRIARWFSHFGDASIISCIEQCDSCLVKAFSLNLFEKLLARLGLWAATAHQLFDQADIGESSAADRLLLIKMQQPHDTALSHQQKHKGHQVKSLRDLPGLQISWAKTWTKTKVLTLAKQSSQTNSSQTNSSQEQHQQSWQLFFQTTKRGCWRQSF